MKTIPSNLGFLISKSLKLAAMVGLLSSHVVQAEELNLSCTLANGSAATVTLDIPLDSSTLDYDRGTRVTGILSRHGLVVSGRQLPNVIPLRGDARMSSKGPYFELTGETSGVVESLRLNIVGPASELPSELIIDDLGEVANCR